MAMRYWVGAFLFVIGAGGYYYLSRGVNLRWWWALVIRLGLLLLAVMAFSVGLGASSGADYLPEILLIDYSDSVLDEDISSARDFAATWMDGKPNREVILFGAGVDYLLSGDDPILISSGSNLYEAIKTAENILAGQPGRILVATDGLVENINGFQEIFHDLNLNGVEIIFLPMQPESYPNDIYVGKLVGVSKVWEGTEFSLRMPIFAPSDTSEMPAMIHVLVNGEELFSPREILLRGGQNQISIPFTAGKTGVMQLEVRVDSAADGFGGNNIAYSTIQVLPEPSVLLVSDSQESVRDFVRGLVSQGFKVEVTSPAAVPTTVPEMEGYQAFIIQDVLSQDLNLEQMKNLQLQVTEFGKGLLFLGGNNSYTLGGYQNTIFAPLMPIKLSPPDRVQRVPITFLLVLDRSGSMAGDRDSDIAPIDLTREGAMRAIETLRSDDYLGVMTFSGVFDWAVDIRPVGDGLALRTAQDEVSRIEAFGGTFMYNALVEAVSQIVEVKSTDYLHILLMSDGISADGSRDEFIQLVEDARRNGITISTIALGSESDPEMLAEIADKGGGRYYLVLDPNDLPEVMISESRAVQAENVQEGLTNMLLNIENHPILADIALNDLPRLNAYNAVQRKLDLAVEDVLISGNFNDPLLSVWRVGLGHVAVWAGDIGEEWVPEMRDWEDQGRFWSQVVRYTLPPPNLGRSHVEIVEGETSLALRFSVSSVGSQGNSTIDPVVVIPEPNQGQVSYNIPKTGPLSYEMEIDKPDPGAYAGIIQYSLSGEKLTLPVSYAVNYPAEWQFAELEDAEEAFDRLVQLSNGSVSSVENELVKTFEEENKTPFGLLEFLMTLLVISWPLEIAIRRRQMPWRRP